MIASSGMALVLAQGQPLWPIINLLLDLTLLPRFNQAIMGFTRPLWILLGHYGSAIMGSASHVIKHRHECP